MRIVWMDVKGKTRRPAHAVSGFGNARATAPPHLTVGFRTQTLDVAHITMICV